MILITKKDVKKFCTLIFYAISLKSYFSVVSLSLMDLFLRRKYIKPVMGVIFGLITVFIMNNSIVITEGRFFDFRHIIMTMAGFIGGPVTAGIAALIGAAYRLYMGGSGALGGITSIIFFGCFGSVLVRLKTIFITGPMSSLANHYW